MTEQQGINLYAGGSLSLDTAIDSNVGINLYDGGTLNIEREKGTALRAIDLVNDTKGADENFFHKAADYIDSVAGGAIETTIGVADTIIKNPVGTIVEGGVETVRGIKAVATGGKPIDVKDAGRAFVKTSVDAAGYLTETPLRLLADNNLSTVSKYSEQLDYYNNLSDKTPEVLSKIKELETVRGGAQKLSIYFNKGADFFDMAFDTDGIDFLNRDSKYTEGELLGDGYSNARLTSTLFGQLPFMGMASGAARTLGKPAAFALTGFIEAGGEYDQIRESDLTQTQKNLSYAGVAVTSAALERYGFLDDANHIGGAVRRRIRTGASEGVTETLQQASQNVIAKMGYDAERVWHDGVAESALLGSLAGFATGPGGSSESNERLEVARDAARDAGFTEEEITIYEDSVMQEMIDNSEEVNSELEERFEKANTELTTMNEQQLAERETELAEVERQEQVKKAINVEFDPKFTDIASDKTIQNMSELVQLKEKARSQGAWEKKNIKELQTEFTAIANKMNIPSDIKVKLLNKVKNVNSVKTFERSFKQAVKTANTAMYNEVKRRNLKDIKSILKDSDLDFGTKIELQSFKRYDDMSVKQLESEWQILEGSSDPIKNEKQRYIAMKGLGKDANAVVTRQVYEDIRNIQLRGQGILVDKLAGEKQLVSDTKERLIGKFDQLHKDGKGRAANVANRGFDLLVGHWKTKMNTLFGKNLATELSMAWEDKLENNYKSQELEESTAEVSDALGVKPHSVRLKVSEMRNTEAIKMQYKDGKRKSPLNEMEVVAHYAITRNATALRKYNEAFTEQSMADLDGYIETHPELAELATVLMDRFPGMYTDMNAIYIKMNNKQLPFVENYFPESSEADSTGDTDAFVGLTGFNESPGAWKKRTAGKVKPKLHIDAMEAYNNYVSEYSWVKSKAEKWSLLNKTFNDIELKNRIRETYGKSYLDDVFKDINDSSIRGRIRYLNTFDKISNKAIDNLASSVILGNLGSAAKQLISHTYWMAEMPVDKYIKYSVQAGIKPRETIAFMNSMDRYFADRFKQGSTRHLQMALANAEKSMGKMEQNATKLSKIDTANVKKTLGLLQGSGDVGAFLFGAKAKYDYLTIDKKVSPEEAMKQVILEGSEVQQTAFESLLSELQKTRGSARVLTLFKNAQMSIINKIKNNAVETARGERTKRQFAKDVAVYSVLSDILYFVASGAIGSIKDEDEEFVDDFLNENQGGKVAFALTADKLAGLPVAGDAARELIRAKTLGFSYDADMPIVSDLINTIKDEHTGEIDVKVWDLLEYGSDIVTGLPVSRAAEITRRAAGAIK